MSKNCAVILAAGEGKRMKANKPKPMMEVLDRPMIDWVLDATEASGVNDTILVVGAYGEQLVDHCGDRSAICWQKERLGTGHAVMMALDYLNASDAENVLILNGDAPFMDAATIAESLALHEANGNAVTVISARLDDPFGYGRIIQGADGSFERIVEQKDATEEEKAIRNVNSGAYWFRREDLIAPRQADDGQRRPRVLPHRHHLHPEAGREERRRLRHGECRRRPRRERPGTAAGPQ